MLPNEGPPNGSGNGPAKTVQLVGSAFDDGRSLKDSAKNSYNGVEGHGKSSDPFTKQEENSVHSNVEEDKNGNEEDIFSLTEVTDIARAWT